ncbi:hypothetical protein SAY87_031296 [Trapa incisa]|uniref:Uncharacterized protein n=1 Tax=Trapa incisa TaxID=236973 RepID=A0AAN7QL09_9MYRT|nr:hypothetical protein SAY87_031296 [Trapa incisa]
MTSSSSVSSSPSIGMTSRPGASAALVSRRSPPRRQIPKRGQDAIDIMRDASFGRRAVHVDLEPGQFQNQKKKKEPREMESATLLKTNNCSVTKISARRNHSRLIPKRGRVKLGIAVAIAHRLASILTIHIRSAGAHFSQ